MKYQLIFFIGLLCIKSYSQTIPTQPQVQAIRDTAIAYNFANPWPDPNTNCAGTSAFCLASYTLNQNTTVADQYIINLPIDAPS